MARRKKVKSVKAKKSPTPKGESPEVPVAQVAEPERKPPPLAMKKAPTKKKTPAKRYPGSKRGRKQVARKRAIQQPKAAQRRRRARYGNAEKARILRVANAQKLTAEQVQAKFGVKPVTYYSWRKKAKGSKRGSQRVVRGSRELAGLVRVSVQERLRQMLPEIVRGEVTAYLRGAFKKRG